VKHRHKEWIIAAVTFVGGLYFFLEFILPDMLAAMLPEDTLPQTLWGFRFDEIHDSISRGVQLVAVMAIGLGIYNILRVHGAKIIRSRRGSLNSVALLLGFFAVVAFECVDLVNFEIAERAGRSVESCEEFAQRIASGRVSADRISSLKDALGEFRRAVEERRIFPHASEDAKKALLAEVDKVALDYLSKDSARTADGGELEKLTSGLKNLSSQTRRISRESYAGTWAIKANHFIFAAFFTPLGSAMFSLLAFYIATAAYRSFRIRSLEALVMMIPALVVMLGQIPHGPLYVWEALPRVRFWLLENVSTPAFRAISFGALIASLAMAVRMWLSLEKSPLTSADSGGEEQ